jgi:hypothetical protein
MIGRKNVFSPKAELMMFMAGVVMCVVRRGRVGIEVNIGAKFSREKPQFLSS